MEEKKERKSLSTWIKSHIVMVVIALIVLIAAIVAVVLFVNNSNNEEDEEKDKEIKPIDVVEAYIEGITSGDISKVLDSMDLKASLAWYNCNGVPEDFKEEYDNIDEDDDDVKEQLESAEDGLEYILDNIDDNYDEYSIKIKKIKEVEKLDSGLYKVKAQIEIKTKDKYGDEEINTNTTIFIIYNNKVVSMN